MFRTIPVDKEGSDYYIEITEGPFKDTQYKYTEIRFMGEDSEGNAMFSYGYEMVSSTQLITEEALPVFEETLGQILHTILQSISEEKELPE